MLLANIYLLCWDYDKLKPLFAFSYITRPTVSRMAFLWESLAWGLLGAAGSGLLMIAGVGNLNRAGLWLVAVFFVLGCIFGLVSVWHRKGLRTV